MNSHEEIFIKENIVLPFIPGFIGINPNKSFIYGPAEDVLTLLLCENSA